LGTMNSTEPSSNRSSTRQSGSTITSASHSTAPYEFKPYELSKSIDMGASVDLSYDAKVTNWLSYFMADQFVWLGMRSMVNSFRMTLQASWGVYVYRFFFLKSLFALYSP
jgi:hypothetical protein